jgi:diadenosine tetraphosphatase ApaH/serine/threonine PP2A family protein phosphatase
MYSSDRIMMVHATPENPEEWNYVFNVNDAETTFEYMDRKDIAICFIGHSHQPIIFEKSPHGPPTCVEDSELRLAKDCKYIINVGSVGQPRDGSPQACVAVFDTDRLHYQLVRVPYPVESTQQKMDEAKIDPFLIQRIKYGR